MKLRGTRTLLRLVPIVLAGSMIAACGTPSSGSGAGSGKSTATTISLLYQAPLTGGADYVGLQGCDGWKRAASEINKAGGIPKGPMKGSKFSVQCVDNGLSADKAASIASRYVSTPSIWAMGGFYSSGNAIAAALVANRANLAVLASNVAADFLTTEVKNTYVILPRLETAGAAAADFCHAYYGATKIAALVPNYAYSPFYLKGLQSQITSEGLQLVSNQTWPDLQTTNWDPYFTKLQSQGAQCIALGGYPPEQCLITKQLRQLGQTQPTIDLTTSWTSPSCQQEAGQYYPGMIFGTYLPAFPAKNSLFTRLSPVFQQEYGAPMSDYATNGYDSVVAIELAIEDGASNRSDLVKYLAGVHGQGIGGPISFSGRRIGFRDLTWMEVTKSDTLQPVAEYGTQGTSATRIFVADCAKRPSCQKNLGASA